MFVKITNHMKTALFYRQKKSDIPFLHVFVVFLLNDENGQEYLKRHGEKYV